MANTQEKDLDLGRDRAGAFHKSQMYFELYYLATPVFFVIDWVLGSNIRTAGFEGHPVMKFLYYAACVGCFFAIRKWPSRAAWITSVESTVNIVSLVIAFAIPYFDLVGRMANENFTGGNPMTVDRAINFLIAGTAACIAFYRNPDPFTLPTTKN